MRCLSRMSRCSSWYCHVYAARIKQFSPRGIFRKKVRSAVLGSRASLPSDNTSGWIGFLLLEQFYPGYYLPSFALSHRLFSVVPSSLPCATSATSPSPSPPPPSAHISGRIASRKNYNCIKDVPRPAHCSSHSRGVEPRKGISIDLSIDFFMESVQPHQRYSKIYSLK